MIKTENLKFRYPDQKTFLLNGVHLKIAGKGITEIAGISGSGKTTLLEILNGIIPHIYRGYREGIVSVYGKDPENVPIEVISNSVSTLIQNFELQLFRENVTDEVNTSSKLAERLGVDKLAGKKIRELSSGEKQRVLILKIIEKGTTAFLMDEPFSSLDNEGKEILRTIIEELGKTVIIFSHEFHFRNSTKFVLSGGEMKVPPSDHLRELGIKVQPYDFSLSRVSYNGTPPLISTKGITFSYGSHRVLDGIDFEIYPGEIVGISGANGTGKTTLGRVLAGFLKPANGKIFYRGRELRNSVAGERIGLIFHDPYTQIFGLRVKDFINFNGVEQNMQTLGLNLHPESRILRLSRGELTKLAIATNTEYEMIIYDEPTNGLDYISLKKFAEFLGKLRDSGKSLLVFSHDLEFLNRVSDRRFELKGGKLIEL